MKNSLPTKGNSFQSAAPVDRLRALASFRTTYFAIVAFVFLYVFSVRGVESLLQRHFDAAVKAATQVERVESGVVPRIRARVDEVVRGSAWVRLGGVRVDAVVLGNDGSVVYVPGLPATAPPAGPAAPHSDADRLLPVAVDVTVAVPHNSLLANAILVAYAAALLTTLYLYQRRVTARQESLLAEAVQARDRAAERAQDIERELGRVRDRLGEVDELESEQAREVEALRSERASLQEKLDALARREHELLSQQASGYQELDSERQALEDLLEEALTDLQSKDEEIGDLNTRLRRVSKDAAAAEGARTREADHLARRLRTLYKNLEVDDRALGDLVRLRDETMKLKAEEGLKRLSDDVETAGARRKVGGLPPGLPVFELGFAGKGRIYYTRGQQRRLRILCIGAKNTQKKDLEYLSKVVTQG